MDPLPAVAALPLTPCPGSNGSDDVSAAPLATPSKSGKGKNMTGGNDEGKLGAGIRRLRESEKRLCESNTKLQVGGVAMVGRSTQPVRSAWGLA